MTTRSLQAHPWSISYRSSGIREDGAAVDILHDFYIPALRRSVRYDRVAGYFRSTSLAVASQGFSAFVASKGKIRLIMGSNLEPDDVVAILDGDQQRYERLLQGELEGDTTWPTDVLRGVQLLAWMVANGHLDLKVALRIHSTTGKPIPSDSVEDGYVHEKWAILSDQSGDSLYLTGSLNESKTALTLNAENIDVHCSWLGARDLQRVEQAQNDFERLWKNEHPGFRVMPLPEAVRQRLISFASQEVLFPPRLQEINGSSAIPSRIPQPSAKELLAFALLKDGPKLPDGRYVGMETAPVTPWPHQAVVARRLIDSWPYSYLLCDEVGLGKTIEAGLAIRSLYLSGIAKRVLIAAPASLTRQWQREMATKFYLPFGRATASPTITHEYLLPTEHEQSNRSLYDPCLTIISTGLMARKERHQCLNQAEKFDIALVDEAHYARRSNPTQGSRVQPKFGALYKTLQDILRGRANSLWLATATPMQLDQVEVSDLVTLTSRGGAFLSDPTLMAGYYELLGKLVSDVELSDQEWTFLQRVVRVVEQQDPVQWGFITSTVIDGATRIDVQRWLNHGTVPRGRGRSGVIRLIFAASPLSRVMLRHTRSLLEIYRSKGKLGANLAKREILSVPPITFTPDEKRVYDQFQLYCDGLAARLAGGKSGRNVSAVGFMLSFLRLRFASSLFAISETMRRRLDTVERTLRVFVQHEVPDDVPLAESDLSELLDESDDDDKVAVESLLKNRTLSDLQWERDQIVELRRLLANLTGTPSKSTAMLGALQSRRIHGVGRIKQTVIFTRFFDTLTDIIQRLRQADPGMLVGTYSGQGGSYYNPKNRRMVSVERDDIKHRFLRGEIDVLVCTDAAAEGLNLQTADLLINYDLPWNPMKVEQRIGRIDRIGQRYETVYVLNLCYVDSAEHIVYGRLLTRLGGVGSVVGTQQVSLLPVTREEFQQLAEGRLSERTLEEKARRRCLEIQRRTQSMEISPQELYAMYSRQAEALSAVRQPVDLPGIWEVLASSRYLRESGCTVLPDVNLQALVLASIPGVADGVVLTTSRETFEEGFPNSEVIPLFATYGEPVFERLLDMFTKFEFPSCIKRIAVELPESGVERIGYAVHCYNEAGDLGCKLIASLHDLSMLRLNEQGCVTEDEVQRLRQELIQREPPRIPTARIEHLNVVAGRQQLLLDYLVVNGLLTSRKNIGQGDPLFWREIAAVEQIGEDTCRRSGTYRIPRIPTMLARKIAPHVLFDLIIPAMGDNGHMDAPLALVRSAVESAMRLADSMKEPKGAFTTESFLGRLAKEIHRLGSRD